MLSLSQHRSSICRPKPGSCFDKLGDELASREVNDLSWVVAVTRMIRTLPLSPSRPRPARPRPGAAAIASGKVSALRAHPRRDRRRRAEVGLGGDRAGRPAGHGPRAGRESQSPPRRHPADPAAVLAGLGRQHPQARRRALVGRAEHQPRRRTTTSSNGATPMARTRPRRGRCPSGLAAVPESEYTVALPPDNLPDNRVLKKPDSSSATEPVPTAYGASLISEGWPQLAGDALGPSIATAWSGSGATCRRTPARGPSSTR